MGLHKLIDRVELTRRAALLARELRIVFTNGCFDLLHVGHVRLLQQARDLGDLLIVGLNSDCSVRALKGADRPLMPELERAELLAALGCVDLVVIFPELTPMDLIRQLRPHVHVKGAEYGPDGCKPLPEAEIVQAYGGEVRLLPMTPALSTTRLIQRLAASAVATSC